MVKRQEIELETEQILHILKSTTGKIVRDRAGNWTLVLDLAEVEIPAEIGNKSRDFVFAGVLRVRGWIKKTRKIRGKKDASQD